MLGFSRIGDGYLLDGEVKGGSAMGNNLSVDVENKVLLFNGTGFLSQLWYLPMEERARLGTRHQA